ncbi:hypothetical protein [Lysobacter capsici]|uniref:hypothetical protein n=1 Tax=Lysobacter capsici TaxID=435897 RepID=UPI001E5B3285|nr:hypothetical protein [Lysobacter capsici]
MDAALRHIDDGHGLWRYADLIEVRCPRCARPGLVRAPYENGRRDIRFACAGCGLHAAGELRCGTPAAQNDWFGPVRLQGRRPCGYCGYQWLSVNRIYEHMPASAPPRLAARCPICARDSQVDTSVHRHRGNEPRDPYLGLPLRLIEPTRHGLAWAYNAQHLQELRRYIIATQRERTRQAGNGSMISRLPTWMKLARHRTTMLKTLDRLGARLLQDDGSEAAPIATRRGRTARRRR